MTQDDVQFKGLRYRSTKKRLWWWPWIEVERMRCVGKATGSEPQMFPAHPAKDFHSGNSGDFVSGEDFIAKLVALPDLSQLEVEAIQKVEHQLRWAWGVINEGHAFARLMLVAKEVPRNIKLTYPAGSKVGNDAAKSND